MKGKVWKTTDPGEPIETLWTFDDIIAYYYPQWASKLQEMGKGHLISPERCVEDFITVHWAEEVTNVPHN